MNPATRIWKERLSAHLRQVSRYMMYAAQSGFGLFLLVVVLGSSYLYGQALQKLPAAFPHTAVLLVWLTPLLSFSPMRTLLKEADLVYLLPLEARMGAYFRSALLYSFAGQAFLAVFAISCAMPLYRHGFEGSSSVQPFGVWLLLALSLKFAHLLGYWTESRLVRSGHRIGFRMLRWLSTAAILYTLLHVGFLAAAALLLLLLAGFAAVVRFLPRHTVNWTYLRAKEKEHRHATLLFFNWFVDVDELPTRVKPRRHWAKLADRLPFRSDHAYTYLFALTLFRTELYGITVRLTLVSLLILLSVSGTGLFAAVSLVFLTVTGVQLSALRRFHRHSVWPALYPIGEQARPVSAAKVAFTAQLVQTFLLTLPMLRPSIFEPWLLAVPLYGVVYAYFLLRRGDRQT